MRLKLDENIPASGAARLAALGHDVHTVRDEGLGGRPDDDVWHAAQAEDRFRVGADAPAGPSFDAAAPFPFPPAIPGPAPRYARQRSLRRLRVGTRATERRLSRLDRTGSRCAHGPGSSCRQPLRLAVTARADHAPR